jgi:hypothetical protein
MKVLKFVTHAKYHFVGNVPSIDPLIQSAKSVNVFAYFAKPLTLIRHPLACVVKKDVAYVTN